MTIEQKQRALEAMAANRALEKAKWEQNNPGKLRFYLVDASGEGLFTAECQAELRTIIEPLRAQNIGVEAPFMAVDGANAVSGFVGEVIVPIINATSPLIVAALAGWFKKSERVVRMEKGDLKLEARNVEELKQMSEIYKSLEREQTP
jgi:hypothetical protein